MFSNRHDVEKASSCLSLSLTKRLLFSRKVDLVFVIINQSCASLHIFAHDNRCIDEERYMQDLKQTMNDREEIVSST